MLVELLSPPDAGRLIRDIIENGSVSFSRHAEEEMAKDDSRWWTQRTYFEVVSSCPASRQRVVAVSRRTARSAVIVAFRSESEPGVVTAWRFSS